MRRAQIFCQKIWLQKFLKFVSQEMVELLHMFEILTSYLLMMLLILTPKAPITTAAEDIPEKLFSLFSEKIKTWCFKWILCRQRIHIKNQVSFFSKTKSKKLECRLLQFLFAL